MGRKRRTPSQNVVRNVEMFMQWRGLSQKRLADRMTELGLTFERKTGRRTQWHPRTVNRLLNNDRRIDVDELYGLALALETTVASLLSPELAAGIDGLDVDFKIGVLNPISSDSFARFLDKPTDRIGSPQLGISGWERIEGELTWTALPSEADTAMRVARTAFEAAHPGISTDRTNAGEVLRWLMAQDSTTEEPNSQP